MSDTSQNELMMNALRATGGQRVAANGERLPNTTSRIVTADIERPRASLVHMHLIGADYPMNRVALLQYAKSHHAVNILPLLERLPEREYSSALEAVKAVIELESSKKPARLERSHTS